MSILYLTSVAVSLGSRYIFLNVLTLKVAMLTKFLHQRKSALVLTFESDFLNTEV